MHPFRPGLLDGRLIALSGAVPDCVRTLLEELGARVCELDPEPVLDRERAAVRAEAGSPLDALVCGLAGADEGPQATIGGLEREWAVVSAAANASFIRESRGRIVLLAPRGGEVPHAQAAAAALENLARTLSVEWARFGITTVAVAPGPATAGEELATLVAFLCSPAGGYFSGCRVDLGTITHERPVDVAFRSRDARKRR